MSFYNITPLHFSLSLSLSYTHSFSPIALVTCNANVMDNEVIVNCPGIDGLPPGNPYQCSVDFSPPESCENLRKILWVWILQEDIHV